MLRIPVFRTVVAIWPFWETFGMSWTEPGTVLAEIRRILRPGGRVRLDWRTDVPNPPGPPLEHRVAPSEAEAMLKGDNWRNVSVRHLGLYSYLLVASAE